MNTFFNTTIEIEDPAGQFVADQEMTVKLTYKSDEKKFRVLIPEPKQAEPRKEKPKPVEIFTGAVTGVKVTKRGDGKLQMSWQITKPENIKSVGLQNCIAEVTTALRRLWEALIDN